MQPLDRGRRRRHPGRMLLWILVGVAASGCQLAPLSSGSRAPAPAPAPAAAPAAAPAPTPQRPAASSAPTRAQALSSAGFIAGGDGWTLNLDSRVLFDSDSDALSPQARADIARLARLLVEAGITQLRVEGHSDNLGPAEINQRLSLRRAESVAREFTAHGLPRANIVATGYGMTRPVADNQTEAGRAQNRRVVVIIPAG